MLQPVQDYRTALILHGIGTPERALEPDEAVYWLTRERFCHLLDRVAEMGVDAPLITFDDGNASDLAIALPELERRGLGAVFFLLTSRLDQPGSLRSQDIPTLAGAGHQIGLHGHAHRDWRRLDNHGRQVEYRDARARLSDLTGVEIRLAAAPFGFYNRTVAHDLHDEGFDALYSSDWGPTGGTVFLRPRNCIDAAMTEAQIVACLTGHIPLRRRPRRWLGLARKRLLPLGRSR